MKFISLSNKVGLVMDTDVWQLLPSILLFIVREDRGALITIQWLCFSIEIAVGGESNVNGSNMQ